MRDWPSLVGLKVRALVETKVSQIAPGRNLIDLYFLGVEFSVVAPPCDVAHEGVGGLLKFFGFVDTRFHSLFDQVFVRAIHEGLHLSISAAGAVARFIEEEWAIGFFSQD